MSSLQIFNFENNNVRIEIINEQPCFCANDVYKILDIVNGRCAISKIEKEDVFLIDTLTNGGVQKMSYVNEAGLYALIFQSRKPQAKEFKKWVFNEVLPQIRKTGKYEVNPFLTASKKDLLKLALEQEEKIEALQIESEQKQEIIDEFITINESKNYTEVAKLLHLSPRTFINKLKELKYIKDNREPYQKYIDKNYFVIKYKKVNSYVENGKFIKVVEVEDKAYPSYLITENGFRYFGKKFL